MSVNVNPSGATGRRRRGMPLPPGTLAGFIVAVIAVLVIAFVSSRSAKSAEYSAAQVAHTLEVMQGIEALLGSLKDAETGQRGFLLTTNERYLDPYNAARAALPGRVKAVRELLADSPEQTQRLDLLEQIVAEKMQELGETIALQRAGAPNDALALVRTDRGKTAMERFRAVLAEMGGAERTLLASRQKEREDALNSTSRITWGGSLVLLLLIGTAASIMAREHRARDTESWLQSALAGLSLRVAGDPPLDQLGDSVLSYLAGYLGAEVGAVYLADNGGSFRRVAGYAMPAGSEHQPLRPGDGLLGQVAKENRVLHVDEVPEGYLPVASALGRSDARELLLAPASVEGVVQAVIELGFFRRLEPADVELLRRTGESLGLAVRSAGDRSRLEALLEETQRLTEELQAQQEELRVNNEELEEQGRALRESQALLEGQQTELEQTNAQLEEHAQLLESHRDELTQSQLVLNAKAAELARSNQYKSEFLANMSHELRTPLNSTLILAKLLADNKPGNLSAEQVRFAQTISSAGNDLLTLINDILDLSKIESGKVELHLEWVDLPRLLDSLQKTLQPVAQEKGLAFDVTLEPDTPRRIETDAQRIGQILKNLLSNAFKFTEHGSVSLRVSAGPAASTLVFAVEDTGIGIAEQHHELVFEAFRQADGSTHRKYGGTGLGLSISRDLARVLGGGITVRSAPGEGSVFTLTLPVSQAAAAALPDAEAEREMAGRGGAGASRGTGLDVRRAPATLTAALTAPLIAPFEPPLALPARAPAVAGSPEPDDDRERLRPNVRLILVIEDDARFAAILRDLAHELDFQCIVAASAGEGLAAATRYRPSAIVLDINLPDYSGLGVLDQLKRDRETRHIPVHVLSVADYAHEALELGAVGYDVKPVQRTQLVEALQRLEAKFSQGMRHVLVVEDDERQRESIGQLLGNSEVQITAVANAAEALERLRAQTFDCMIVDFNLPDLSGHQLLQRMSEEEGASFPPVIVYTGRALTREEEQQLRRFSTSIIIKDARSPERLLDEVTLFLHQVESTLPAEVQRMLKAARDRDASLEGRRILVVEDDVRNIFALTSVLEPKGAKIELARNGREALAALDKSRERAAEPIELVLMDIMMPEMDGLTAMREIRKQAAWKKLPIIALTAKAMRDDQEKCLAAGANDYIAKPLDVEKLLSLVRVWMPK